jgi:hypothetical protein
MPEVLGSSQTIFSHMLKDITSREGWKDILETPKLKEA